jgi:photosystem II stability/assembly factor-like uncharacterized protein
MQDSYMTRGVSVVLALAASLTPTGWRAQESGVTARLRGVSAVTAQVAWASGADGTILRTADGGASWHRLASPSTERLDFRDIDAIDADTARILSIGSGAASRIYRTSDAGAHWTLEFTNTDPDAFFDGMAFWDFNHGIAVSDSVNGTFVIIRTDDGGHTWSRVPSDRLPPALPNEGAFAASGTSITVVRPGLAWMATGAADRARVLRSADAGRSWQVAETPVCAGKSAGIFSIAFRDAQHGVIVGGDYTRESAAVENVAVSGDGGVTWTSPRGSGLSRFRSVVAPVPGAAATFIAIGPLGGYTSIDDGQTWAPSAAPGADTSALRRAPQQAGRRELEGKSSGSRSIRGSDAPPPPSVQG